MRTKGFRNQRSHVNASRAVGVSPLVKAMPFVRKPAAPACLIEDEAINPKFHKYAYAILG